MFLVRARMVLSLIGSINRWSGWLRSSIASNLTIMRRRFWATRKLAKIITYGRFLRWISIVTTLKEVFATLQYFSAKITRSVIDIILDMILRKEESWGKKKKIWLWHHQVHFCNNNPRVFQHTTLFGVVHQRPQSYRRCTRWVGRCHLWWAIAIFCFLFQLWKKTICMCCSLIVWLSWTQLFIGKLRGWLLRITSSKSLPTWMVWLKPLAPLSSMGTNYMISQVDLLAALATVPKSLTDFFWGGL